MSQRPNTIKSSAVCRRLVFDEEPAPEEEEAAVAADHQVEEEQTPQHLEEARLDNIHNTFVEELQRSRDEAKEKWNFDFETETPLDGDWEWEPVNDDDRLRDSGRDNVQNNP